MVEDTATSAPLPLVPVGQDLSAGQVQRYSRHLLLDGLGRTGQRRLSAARVLVVGAGGLGSPALLYLAAAGVGTLGVVDDDLVEASNLQRQVAHRTADVGTPKVDSAAAAVQALNPAVTMIRHNARLSAQNVPRIMSGYDLVLDGSDNFETRYVVDDAAAALGLPVVWGSVLRFDGQVSVFWAGRGPRFRDVFPTQPPDGSVPSCGQAGVLGAVCGAVGSVMAVEAIKLITGIGAPLLGHVLVFDALQMDWRSVPVTASGRNTPARPGLDTAAATHRPHADVRTVAAVDLADALAAPSTAVLLDVRDAGELEIVAIPGAVHLPLAVLQAGGPWAQLDLDRRVIVYCRSGVRSAAACEVLTEAGFADVRSLAGGVLEWVRTVRPDLPTY